MFFFFFFGCCQCVERRRVCFCSLPPPHPPKGKKPHQNPKKKSSPKKGPKKAEELGSGNFQARTAKATEQLSISTRGNGSHGGQAASNEPHHTSIQLARLPICHAPLTPDGSASPPFKEACKLTIAKRQASSVHYAAATLALGSAHLRLSTALSPRFGDMVLTASSIYIDYKRAPSW